MLAAIRPTVSLLGRSAVRAAPKPFAAPLARAGFASSIRVAGVQKRFTEEHEWVSFDDATNIGTLVSLTMPRSRLVMLSSSSSPKLAHR